MSTPTGFRASLSGSGAKLGWHVGVLLGYQEDLRWPCREYRGSSGGGLVAVMAACGMLRWFAELLPTLKTEDLYVRARLWDLWKGYRYSLTPLRRLMEGLGILDFVVQTPCQLAVYDIQTQQPHRHRLNVGTVLGDHQDAILGTMAVPGLFPPTHGGVWVDGGVTEMVPGVEPAVRMVQEPWVVSVATPRVLRPLQAPPANIKAILMAVLDGISAATVRDDLAAIERYTPYRLHALPNADLYPSFVFDPPVSAALMKLGREDVHRNLQAHAVRAARFIDSGL